MIHQYCLTRQSDRRAHPDWCRECEVFHRDFRIARVGIILLEQPEVTLFLQLSPSGISDLRRGEYQRD